MEFTNFTIPCMLAGSQSYAFGDDFTIYAEFKPDIIGGFQTILSKRVVISRGNRPGIIVGLRGSHIEVMTFADGDTDWTVCRSIHGAVKVGEFYELCIFRSGSRMQIYLNGINRTDPLYSLCAGGDINCGTEIFIGMQIYNELFPPKLPFQAGRIQKIGIYDGVYYRGAEVKHYKHNPLVLKVSEIDAETRRHYKIPEGI